MKEQFIDNCNHAIGLPDGKRFLLAVSGGIDSMVLYHLFELWKVPFAVAHVNFQLRGEESDLDEEFIRKQAQKNETPIYFLKAEATSYAEKQKVSIQMAAREIRYQFLRETAKQNNFNYIVTAHHLNDQAETFFINLARGTGIDGLCGMQILEGNLFRPLLTFSKEEIQEYARLFNISFREDSSNLEDKYVRNKIRHHIIPLLEEINPSFIDTFGKNISILKTVRDIHNHEIEKLRKQMVKINDFGFEIELEPVLKYKHSTHLLFEFIQPFHFTIEVAESIIRNVKEETGKRFFSHTHRLLVNRGVLIITKILPSEVPHYPVNDIKSNLTEPIHLEFSTHPPEIEIEKSVNIAYLDIDKVKTPLAIRRWHKGDSFFPFGMKGKKKLSDFFIDLKLSLVEKENTWLLTSEDQIIWVIGKRIDDRFKVTQDTRLVLKIRYLV